MIHTQRVHLSGVSGAPGPLVVERAMEEQEAEGGRVLEDLTVLGVTLTQRIATLEDAEVISKHLP